MNLENIRMLELAAEQLGELLEEVVFVGGATVELASRPERSGLH